MSKGQKDLHLQKMKYHNQEKTKKLNKSGKEVFQKTSQIKKDERKTSKRPIYREVKSKRWYMNVPSSKKLVHYTPWRAVSLCFKITWNSEDNREASNITNFVNQPKRL